MKIPECNTGLIGGKGGGVGMPVCRDGKCNCIFENCRYK